MGTTVFAAQVDPRVVSFLEKPRKMLINGNWVDAVSGKTFPTYDPSTGDVLAQVFASIATHNTGQTSQPKSDKLRKGIKSNAMIPTPLHLLRWQVLRDALFECRNR